MLFIGVRLPRPIMLEDVMNIVDAWTHWWDSLGHVARLNRDKARVREAFEAGYEAAVKDSASKAQRRHPDQEIDGKPENHQPE